jgi:hypothetical protein
MAITSYGYAATIAANTPWALMQYTLGQEYFALDGAAARVTPVSAGTREVDIAAGYIGGQGVLDYNSAPIRLQLPTVASGTSYFLIVARRTWSTTQATSFVAIPAGTSATLPARNTSPGVLDDQPIALVPLTAGQTVPGTPIDLRAIGSKNGTYFAFSTLVLNYLTRVGTIVRIGTSTYTRIVNSSYVASWERDLGVYGRVALPTASAAGIIVTAPGWTAGSPMINVGALDGNAVSLDLQVRRTGAALGASAQGNFNDTVIGVISSAYRPRRRRLVTTMLAFATSSTERVNYGSGLGLSFIDPSGNWVLVAGMPSIWITPPTNTSAVSIWASVDFLREDATP